MKTHKLKLNGVEVTAAEFHRRGKVGGTGVPMVASTAYSEAKPLISDGIGCMKSQVEDMRSEIARRNIMGVKVRDNGQLEITSRRGRREVLRMRGLADADGCYGD